MTTRDLIDEAYDETLKGGNLEKASALALLALASAVRDVAAEIGDVGTGDHPLHVMTYD